MYVKAARFLYIVYALWTETPPALLTRAACLRLLCMHVQIVQDIVRGRTSKIPLALLTRLVTGAGRQGRLAVRVYLSRFARAMALGRAAAKDGQLLRELAWARLHLRVLDAWCQNNSEARAEGGAVVASWLGSYERVLMCFPVPVTH